jgi:hypothetical protein
MINSLQRLLDFCNWLEEEKKKSPFSEEAWQELVKENNQLKRNYKDVCTQLNRTTQELNQLKDLIK